MAVVQGPRSREFLRSITDGVDLNRLPFFRFSPAVINDTELILSRSGYTGELGYELYTPAEEAGALWEYLLKQGKEFGLQPYGVLAMQSLRIEKALPLYGPDINESVNPFQLGTDRWVRLDKRGFIGRDALLRIQEQGIEERWVGLHLDAKTPAVAGDAIYRIGDVATSKRKKKSGAEAEESTDAVTPGTQIGRVTSSAIGYSVGKTLALAYLRTSHAWSGSKVVVMMAGRPVTATVIATPFFDPTGARMRAKASDGTERVKK